MNRTPRYRRRHDVEPLPTPVHDVIVETRLLFHQLRTIGEKLHANDTLSAGARGLLLSLHQGGPRTVPQLARSRPVSRQHIQSLVNPLRERGLVELLDNPAHKRSKRVGLTPAGRELVTRVLEREAKPLGRIAAQIGARKLADAAAVLQQLRELLANEIEEMSSRAGRAG